MSFLPSASPPAVHQLKNSKLPLALGSGLMPSAASASRPWVAVMEVVEPGVFSAAAASVGVSAAITAVGVSAAAATVLVGTAGTAVAVGVSVPQAARSGMSITARAASQATRVFNIDI